MVDYSLKHVSIRVPWHDARWNGTVCNAPLLNSACTKLKRIAGRKNDQAEILIAGKRLADLPEAEWPCCIGESAGFMAPFEFSRTQKHPFSDRDHYKHLRPTSQRFPAFSAGVIPFRWLMRERIDHLRQQCDLDVDISREPGSITTHPGGTKEETRRSFLMHSPTTSCRKTRFACSMRSIFRSSKTRSEPSSEWGVLLTLEVLPNISAEATE